MRHGALHFPRNSFALLGRPQNELRIQSVSPYREAARPDLKPAASAHLAETERVRIIAAYA